LLVDRNGFQANARTEELIPLEPLAAKFAAFGARCVSVDGHDYGALARVLTKVPFGGGAPSVVIARTVRGKGLPSIENRADRWFCRLAPDEVNELVAELDGHQAAVLRSPALTVR
jgi:transketolase